MHGIVLAYERRKERFMVNIMAHAVVMSQHYIHAGFARVPNWSRNDVKSRGAWSQRGIFSLDTMDITHQPPFSMISGNNAATPAM